MRKYVKILLFLITITLFFVCATACGDGENSTQPSVSSSPLISAVPSLSPSLTPSVGCSVAPGESPSVTPSGQPSVSSSQLPSLTPSGTPTTAPTLFAPSVMPAPTILPTTLATTVPTTPSSLQPTVTPSSTQTVIPSVLPTLAPSGTPTVQPTQIPTVVPTMPQNVFTVNGEKITGLTAYGKTLSQITVPSTIGGRVITHIGMEAFYDCDALTRVILPESITHIGKYAFAKCNFLQSVEFAEGSNLSVIGDCAFYECEGLTEIHFPAQLTQVCYAAFQRCASLTEILLPASVTHVGENAFYECSALTVYCVAQNAPSTWNVWWNADFCPVVWNCTTAPEGVDGYAYTVIDGLRYAVKGEAATVARQPLHLAQSVVIPASITYNGSVYPVTKIADFAFAENAYIAEVSIPSSVTYVGENAFYRCVALTVYSQAEEQPTSWHENWNDSDCPVVWNCNENAVATNGNVYVLQNGLRYSICNGKASLTKQSKNLIGEIVIPQSIVEKGVTYAVAEISAFAFENCVYISGVTIPCSVTAVGNQAFYGCHTITLYCQMEVKPENWHYDWNIVKDSRRALTIWNS